ncbi:MAG: DUF3343 domain-containing protein [Erysipelotrichaceae bacterium]|nr:DUF3343 domain-containing protein [Erysipelotrichaceae bacterium]
MGKITYCVITFPSTMDALNAEQLAKEYGMPGRMIPLPTAISAGCGLCWATEPEHSEKWTEFIKKQSVEYERITEVTF